MSVAVLLVATAATVLWVLLPGFVAIEGTGVLLDARPFSCRSSADVFTDDAGDGSDAADALLVPAIRLRPGLDCTMTVERAAS